MESMEQMVFLCGAPAVSWVRAGTQEELQGDAYSMQASSGHCLSISIHRQQYHGLQVQPPTARQLSDRETLAAHFVHF